MDITLKNCILESREVDVHISGGVINKIGKDLEKEIIDCTGLILMPGIIDGHVHFREPGAEHKEDWLTGSRAAVKGGVTTVLDMPNNNPPIIDEASLNLKRELAKKSVVNYGFHIGATTDNLSFLNSAQNIAGIKIYFGSSTGNLLVDRIDDIKKIFNGAKRLFLVHAEDEAFIQEKSKEYSGTDDPIIHTIVRAPEAAILAVKNILAIVERTKARVHFCHVSTAGELKLIKSAKAKGLPVTCEVAPHHLFLNSSEYGKQGNWVKMNPPLRPESDRLALWRGIADGTVDTIATDHAPHTRDEKMQPYWQAPAGVPGVETMLPLLLNEVSKGRIDLKKVVELVCENPARIFKIKHKGKIDEGYDADLVLLDMQMEKEVINEEMESKCAWTPFAGKMLTGWPTATIIGGNIVYNSLEINEQFKGKEIKYEL
ncbi:MAG: dihydroorotase [Patescibacteria group bacterium]|jgi:dihydroorotase